MMNTSDERCDTLYYDGSCPLCRAEMDKLAKHKREDLDLVDLHSLQYTGNTPSKLTMLKELHLQTKDGTWLRGIDANIDAWRGTKWFSLWRLLKLPGMYSVAKTAYRYWAEKRFSVMVKNREFDGKKQNKDEKPAM